MDYSVRVSILRSPYLGKLPSHGAQEQTSFLERKIGGEAAA